MDLLTDRTASSAAIRPQKQCIEKSCGMQQRVRQKHKLYAGYSNKSKSSDILQFNSSLGPRNVVNANYNVMPKLGEQKK